MKEFIGILPAAGLGSRLHPCRFPKELLPIVFTIDDIKHNKKAYPRLAAEYAIQSMVYADIKLCLIVISDNKTEVLKYFGDGKDFDINIAYLHQKEPDGLSDSINKGFEFYKDKYICLALPDTIFYPTNAITIIRKEILTSQADLVLGVFPTSTPEQLGPVHFDTSGNVIKVLDKPTESSIFNTWGIAVWSPTFSALLNSQLQENRKQPLGNMFDLAIVNGLNVRAVFFETGRYLDLGTPEGLFKMIIDNEE